MEKAKNTKEQILEAALRLFAENSFHGASIRDIAKSISKRESSIYNHYKSKDDIFESIIDKFSQRNFGALILTDELINKLSKPEKFFVLLSKNLLDFWDTEEERMFIKILLSRTSIEKYDEQYSLDNYISDFRKLCEFIFKEMMNHKFIGKLDVKSLSRQFISPLFLYQIEIFLGKDVDTDTKRFITNHVDFFWNAIKR